MNLESMLESTVKGGDNLTILSFLCVYVKTGPHKPQLCDEEVLLPVPSAQRAPNPSEGCKCLVRHHHVWKDRSRMISKEELMFAKRLQEEDAAALRDRMEEMGVLDAARESAKARFQDTNEKGVDMLPEIAGAMSWRKFIPSTKPEKSPGKMQPGDKGKVTECGRFEIVVSNEGIVQVVPIASDSLQGKFCFGLYGRQIHLSFQCRNAHKDQQHLTEQSKARGYFPDVYRV